MKELGFQEEGERQVLPPSPEGPDDGRQAHQPPRTSVYFSGKWGWKVICLMKPQGPGSKEEVAKCLEASLETLTCGCYWHDLL